MTNELEQKLTENAVEVMEWIRNAKEFGVEQAPQVCQEIIKVGIFNHAFACLVTAIVATVGVYLSLFFNKKRKEIEKSRREGKGGNPYYPSQTEENFGLASLLVLILPLFATPLFANSLYWLILITLFPRYYLFRQLAQLF
jgi:hypothetical protein